MIRRPPRSPLFPSPTLFRSKITPAVLTEYGSALPAVPGSGRDSKVAKLLTPCPSWYVVVTAGPLTTWTPTAPRSEEHTSELQSRLHLVCRLLLEKNKDIPQE